ncbi:unnamed protein product [Lymnaea stagnalis]|uniref:Glucosamine 6-phosphate N-acetyltransferase n=1 Tax=Lymnaea stagnalis TaxID=6523 RepID=A0AAV2H494_LYMST
MMSNIQENGYNDTYLFDPEVFLRIDESKFKSDYKNDVTPLKPGVNLQIRPLRLGDFDKGFLDLLKELTVVGDVSQEQFITQFNKMKACSDTYYITVIEDTSKSQIIGTATLVMEKKFIHQATARARIEDVVVGNDYRGLQLGKVLVDLLVCLSQVLGCYKVSLECKEHNVKFYAMFGFEKSPEQNFMQIRFFD